MTSRTMRVLGAASILALAAGACGGKSQPNAAQTTPPTSPSPTPTASMPTLAVNDHGTQDVTRLGGAEFTLRLEDKYFRPTFFKAKSGQTIDVELENEGALAHTFTIESLGVDVTLEPREKKSERFRLPSAGDVSFICKFHVSAGMGGYFFFGAKPAAGAPTSASDGYGNSSG